jgi:hypothetical protein
MLARPLPDVPAHLWKFGEEQALGRRLARLIDWLDGNLAEMPVEVEKRPGGHCAWVFGAIGYRVDRESRSVLPFTRVGGTRLPWTGIDVELFKPLRTREWITPLLAHIGASAHPRQGHLFVDEAQRKRQEAWLTGAAWRRIRCDPRFRRLRRQLLPSALGLDPEIMSIALRARISSRRDGVSARLYSHVWRHLESYRRVAAENASLLPLVTFAWRANLLRAGEDPVAGVRRLFLAGGVSPAGWRYLARHGAKIFSRLWGQMLCGSPLREAIRHLKLLDAAGLPPPPPPAVIDLVSGYSRAPAPIVGLVLRTSRTAMECGHYCGFLGEAADVLAWADAEKPELDDRQRQAGWRWAARQAIEWRRRKGKYLVPGEQSWHSAIGAFSSPPHLIVPLENVEAMVDEGLAMRNCLAECIPDCQAAIARFFSIRDAASGARVAVFEVHLDKAGERWVLGEVKGPRNTGVPEAIRQKAAAVAQLYETLDLTPWPLRGPPEGVQRCREQVRSEYLFTVPAPRLTP